MSLISGKHKMIILYCLMEYKVVRFNELKRYLKNISDIYGEYFTGKPARSCVFQSKIS